jgi:hypothetical protein
MGWGFAEFDQMGELYRRTLSLLHRAATEGVMPPEGADVLATEALPHIEDLEAGFRAWLRAADSDVAELRSLVLHGPLGLPEAQDQAEERAALAEALQARAGAGGERTLRPPPSRRLAALAHARLVFAMLPRTPPPQVRFPAGRPTYADIPVPRGPTELARRIEELERELWWLATGRPARTADAAYRRTYGFFDAADRLFTWGSRAPG